MQRRRLLLAIALIAALAALAATVAAPPRGERGRSDERAESRPPPPTTDLELRAGRRPPQRVNARVGEHVLVRIAVPEPGEVGFEDMGLTDTATPRAPATFDLLLERPGDHPATFRPAEGRPKPAGTLVVRPRYGRARRSPTGGRPGHPETPRRGARSARSHRHHAQVVGQAAARDRSAAARSARTTSPGSSPRCSDRPPRSARCRTARAVRTRGRARRPIRPASAGAPRAGRR